MTTLRHVPAGVMLALSLAACGEPDGLRPPEEPVRDLLRVEEFALEVERELDRTWMEGFRQGDPESVLAGLGPGFRGEWYGSPPWPEAAGEGLVAADLTPSDEPLEGMAFARLLTSSGTGTPLPHERARSEIEDVRLEKSGERAVVRIRLRCATRLEDERTLSIEGHARLELVRGVSWQVTQARWEGGTRVVGRPHPFVDVTRAVGLREAITEEQRDHLQEFIDKRETLSLGCLLALDWNGDGAWDLLSSREDQTTTLFLNDGRSGFIPTPLPLRVPRDSARGFLWLDLDGDGLEELASSRVSHYVGEEAWMDLWTRNEAGTWERREGALRFPNQVGVRRVAVQALVPIDANGDGLVELFGPVYGDMNARGPDYNTVLAHDGGHNPYFLNEGGLQFREASRERGLEGTQYTFVATAFDFDGDGDEDLWEGNDFGPNLLWTNDGRGFFTPTPDSPLVAGSTYTMGVTLTDLEGSGAWSLYISNMSSPVGRRLAPLIPGVSAAARERVAGIAAGNMLFRSDRGWQQVPAGLDDARWAWGCVFFDAENDGDPDLVVTNGFTSHRDRTLPDWDTWFWRQVADDAGFLERGESTMLVDDGGFEGSYAGYQRDRLYLQDGGTFFEAAWALGVDLDHDGRAVVPVDVDGDGDLDLAYQHLTGLRLLENTSPPRSFLRLQLVGRAPGTHALGAVVTIEANGKTQRDRVRPVEGFHSQIPSDVHFGLGNAKRVDRLTVEWPGGERTVLVDLPVGVRLTIEQGVEGHRSAPLPLWSRAGSEAPHPPSRHAAPRPILLFNDEGVSPFDDVLEAERSLDWVANDLPGAALYDGDGRLVRSFDRTPSTADLDAWLAHLALPPDHPDVLVQKGRDELRQGRLRPAEAYIRRALVADEESAYAHEAMGEAHYVARRAAESEASYRRALELDPDYGLGHYNLGILLVERGRVDEALDSLQEACRILPDHFEVLLATGETAALAGRTDLALEVLGRAARADLTHPAPHVLLGKLHGQARRYAPSAEAFRAALERDPTDGDAREGLRRAESLLSSERP